MSRRARRSRGQALTELAIAAPLLALLLVGAAQIGAIVYAQVTIDTAAREGARIGSEQPGNSGVFTGDVTCTPTMSPPNPVCTAVYNSSGALDYHSFTVTLTHADSGSGDTSPSCGGTSVTDGYVVVTVSYDAPVFVPIVDRLLSTSPGVHKVTASVKDRVEPCTLTNGS